MKRVTYKVDPIFNGHKYIVAIVQDTTTSARTTYKYCQNLTEVNKEKALAPNDSVIQVFSATHKFLNAWTK